MGTSELPLLKDRTTAFMFIRVKPGWAEELANQVTARGFNPEDPDQSSGFSWTEVIDDREELLGVYWAAVVSCEFHVVVGIRVLDNRQLGQLVRQIKRIDLIVNPNTAVVTSVHSGGKEDQRVKNGPP